MPAHVVGRSCPTFIAWSLEPVARSPYVMGEIKVAHGIVDLLMFRYSWKIRVDPKQTRGLLKADEGGPRGGQKDRDEKGLTHVADFGAWSCGM